MKPAWDKLMSEYAGHATALIADVDCTAAGEELCGTVGVQGYPTIKWGDPSSLEDYQGGRDYEELATFAKENLKPMCSPANIDLCDDEKKALITQYMEMGEVDLESLIDNKEGELKASEENFEAEVQKLQEAYEKLEKDKSDKQAKIKASGMSLMKAVLAAKKPKEEL